MESARVFYFRRNRAGKPCGPPPSLVNPVDVLAIGSGCHVLLFHPESGRGCSSPPFATAESLCTTPALSPPKSVEDHRVRDIRGRNESRTVNARIGITVPISAPRRAGIGVGRQRHSDDINEKRAVLA